MKSHLAAFTALLVACASLAWPQDAPPVPHRVTSKEMGERLINRVAPLYPPLARQARIQGTVMLLAVINKSGDVQSVQLISGHPMLAPAAIAAVKQWKYRPYLLNDEAVEVETTVQVNFTLADDPHPETTGGPTDQNGAFIASSGIRVSEGVMRATRTEKVDAVYPPEAEQARIQGQVVLSVRLNKSGEVASISLISGHPMLIPAAIDAVKRWKYKPYLLNDDPVEVETMVRLNFTLPLKGLQHGLVVDTPLDEEIPSTAPGIGVPQRIRVSAGVEQGLLISKVSPEYPPDAREQHIQGGVILKALIDKEGNIANLELVSGHPMLAAAAIDAVKLWKYRPYLLNGNPVMVETQIQVNFTLTE
jgi:TonB family protein